MFDLMLAGGMVYRKGGIIRADVGVRGSSVAAVGDLSCAAAHRKVRADGLVIAPGFVDPHTHSDFTILACPAASSKVRQGVTTEIGGNCGYSPFPVARERLDDLRDYVAFMPVPLDFAWETASHFLDRVTSVGPTCNVGLLVGHGSIRIAVMGMRAGGADEDELRLMVRLLEQALDQGCLGLSLGLGYAPGCFATQDELITLARVLAARDSLLTVHLRSEDEGLLDAVEEAVGIARASGVRLHISHLKAYGRPNWGKAIEAVSLLERAADEDVDVTWDVYPYEAAYTSLAAIFPKRTVVGGTRELLRRLDTKTEREGILRELDEYARRVGGWSLVRLSNLLDPDLHAWEGLSLTEIAAGSGLAPAEIVVEVIRRNPGAAVIIHAASWPDIEAVMCHPLAMIGSDGKVLCPEGPLGRGKTHPRNYGAYPRVLREMVRERQVLTLEQALEKMTVLPARRFGLVGRGEIVTGSVADLVAFDPDRVTDRATYEQPHQFPDGIEYVVVGGQLVVGAGESGDGSAGSILRRG